MDGCHLFLPVPLAGQFKAGPGCHGGIAPGDNPQGNRQVRRRHTVAGAAGPVAIRLETLVVLPDNHQIRLAVEAVYPFPGLGRTDIAH